MLGWRNIAIFYTNIVGREHLAKSHWLHLFGFSPLCVFKCLLKSPAWINAKSHWLHLCAFKCLLKSPPTGVAPGFSIGNLLEILPNETRILRWRLHQDWRQSNSNTPKHIQIWSRWAQKSLQISDESESSLMLNDKQCNMVQTMRSVSRLIYSGIKSRNEWIHLILFIFIIWEIFMEILFFETR